jgi:hypothetical protein
LYVEYESDSSEEFIVANLSMQNPNVTLDLAFTYGEKFAFKVTKTVVLSVFLLKRQKWNTDIHHVCRKV